ncbi:hypothetical protein BJ917_1575 [Pseudomonas sp. WPR_5_2]|nr:hypothetical protein BJ917_1575 [Pseudomonas sp. WPR_5_2]
MDAVCDRVTKRELRLAAPAYSLAGPAYSLAGPAYSLASQLPHGICNHPKPHVGAGLPAKAVYLFTNTAER